MENEKIIVKITAIDDIVKSRGPIVFMDTVVAIAFSRDSGAKVGYECVMLAGEISSGGSQKNYTTEIRKGSTFKINVPKFLYEKNKTRIKRWLMEESQLTDSDKMEKKFENATIE